MLEPYRDFITFGANLALSEVSGIVSMTAELTDPLAHGISSKSIRYAALVPQISSLGLEDVKIIDPFSC